MPEVENAEQAPAITQTVEEQVEITNFGADMAVVSERLPMEVAIPLTPSTQHTDGMSHSVVSFLQRTQLLKTFSWPASAMRSENLLKINFNGVVSDGLRVPTDLFRQRPLLHRKLDGFTSFKATCVLKLVLNAQKFQCGRLIMVAAPMPLLLGNRKEFIFSHVSNAQNVNHVQMDIAQDTEVELRIPFISPYNSFDLVDGKFDWAEVRVMVYSPLNSVAGSCLQCVLYGHFEDVELGCPTSGNVKIQSLAASRQAVDVAKRQEASGRLTGALAALGTSAVNKAISFISPFTGALDSMAAAAGWSKPILAKPSRVVLSRPTEGFNYMDGVDQSLVLGITASNAVEPMPGLVGTNIDETSFNTLKRIPQMIGAFDYSNTTISCADDPVKLWECAVTPTYNVPACYYLSPQSDTGVISPPQLRWKQPTTLNYIVSPFLYWTGSLVYTFKFVKTKFHSGRVEISFHPFVNVVQDNRMDFVYRLIVDLRDKSEVSFTVPYVSPQPWKRISTYLDPVNESPPSPGRLKDIITGMLYVRALTPLLNAGNQVPSKIECVVEVRAGDDFEVQAPVTSKFLPFSFQNDVAVAKIQSGVTSSPSRTWSGAWAWAKNSVKQFTIANTGQIKRAVVAFSIDVVNWKSDFPPNMYDFTLGNSWNIEIAKFTGAGMAWQRDYTIVLENPSTSDITINLTMGELASSDTGNPNPWLYIRVNIQDLQNNRVSLPIATEGSNILATKLDSSQIPLSVSVNATPLDVNLKTIDQLVLPIRVLANNTTIDMQQLPLPVSVMGTSTVLVDSRQIPLPVTGSTSGGTIKIDPSQIPLPVSTTPIKIDSSQIPLPVTGGGGGVGGTVKIDDSQLPLWTSAYDWRGTREQAKIQSQVTTAGITETRTRALEGWIPPSITGNDSDIHRASTAGLCCGEKFQSFRQYAKRFAFCAVNGIGVESMMDIQPVEMIRPGAINLRPTAQDSTSFPTQLCLYAPNSSMEVSGSPLSFVAGMYAFYRGSTRFKIWMDPRMNPPSIISGHLEYARQTTDQNTINDNIENFMCPIAYEIPSIKQFAEFQVPYYSPTIVSSTWSHGNDNQFDVPLANLVIGVPEFPTPDDAKRPIKVAVAAGDDMDFHQFIGPPPVLNISDIGTTDRAIHYPPGGFTPTQKILSKQRKEAPATSFIPVTYSSLKVVNNISGAVCSKTAPTILPSTVRMRRAVVDDGYDTVDTQHVPINRNGRNRSPDLMDYVYG